MNCHDLYREIYHHVAKDYDVEFVKNRVKTSDIPKDEKNKLLEAFNFYEDFKRDGIVIFRNIYQPSRVREAVDDIWDHILSLPYKPTIKKKLQEVWNSLKKDPWRDPTSEEISTIRQYYPMIGGFGALTRSPVFHLTTQWDARQDPVIVSVYQKLLEHEDIKVYYDRVSFKMPGQGETEFTHWDSNPWSWPQEEYEGVQGILALSNTTFRAVPRTNTEQFRKEFISKYPKPKRHDQCHVSKDHDPMKLQDKVQTYRVNKGDLVVWSNRLLHEARINKTKKIRYAYFINYFPKGNPNPNMTTSYKKAKINFENDRKISLETGSNPAFFPSGTSIRLYAKSHLMYHPQKLNEFCELFTTGCEDYTYKSGKKKDTTVQIPTTWNVSYIKPTLTSLGKSLI